MKLPERPILQEGRAVGNTTRLVDYYVQIILQTGVAMNITDHVDLRVTNEDLMSRIYRRLQTEHGITWASLERPDINMRNIVLTQTALRSLRNRFIR